MAEVGETQTEVSENPQGQEPTLPSRRDILKKGLRYGGATVVGGGIGGTMIAGYRFMPPLVRNILERFKDYSELPPLPEFQPPERDQRVLVIPLLGHGENEPLTVSQIEEALDSVASNYDRFSFAKLSYSFKVIPWQKADLPSDRIDIGRTSRIGDRVVDFLKESGVENYQTRLYVVYPGKDDKFGGRAAYSPVNGYKRAISHAYPDDWFNFAKITIHELGHTLGVPHANSVDESGKNVEYGGSYDPMGTTGDTLGYELNAPQRVAMGWVTKDQIQSVTKDGEYTIYPLDMRYPGQVGVTKVLRFQRPNTNERYYLSLRAQGAFSLELHRWDEKLKSPSVEVVVPVKDKDIGWVHNGEEYYDSENGIRVTQISRKSLYTRTPDAGTVGVKITFDKK